MLNINSFQTVAQIWGLKGNIWAIKKLQIPKALIFGSCKQCMLRVTHGKYLNNHSEDVTKNNNRCGKQTITKGLTKNTHSVMMMILF
jgi:hypothetical protein